MAGNNADSGSVTRESIMTERRWPVRDHPQRDRNREQCPIGLYLAM
jgi:hypothetical protein